jgi:hypothetical protein
MPAPKERVDMAACSSCGQSSASAYAAPSNNGTKKKVYASQLSGLSVPKPQVKIKNLR